MATSNKDLNASLGNLEKTLKIYFVDKAPFQLPDNVKEFIVAYGPWITLILLIMSLPVILAALGLTAVLSPFAAMGGYHAGVNIISVIFSVIAIVLEAMALPGLFRRSKAGWNLLFYASIVSIVGSLISLDIAGAIISVLIGWYFLFQIRSYYK